MKHIVTYILVSLRSQKDIWNFMEIWITRIIFTKLIPLSDTLTDVGKYYTEFCQCQWHGWIYEKQYCKSAKLLITRNGSQNNSNFFNFKHLVWHMSVAWCPLSECLESRQWPVASLVTVLSWFLPATWPVKVTTWYLVGSSAGRSESLAPECRHKPL